MINPVVLICTHARVEMTSTNIRSLLVQSKVPKIVLVCSTPEERNIFLKDFPSLAVVAVRPNNPLGAKFQAGVVLARTLNPNPLIITGSDDILGKNFIGNACIGVQAGNDFIGLKQWFIYHNNQLFLYDYLAPIPLGTRIYSFKMLEAIGWDLFDLKANRLLDDHGFHKVRRTNLKIRIVTDAINEGFNVISIKGDWPMLNTYEKMKSHPNLRLKAVISDPKAIL